MERSATLHVPTMTVVKAAERAWGQPFSEERNSRLTPRAKTMRRLRLCEVTLPGLSLRNCVRTGRNGREAEIIQKKGGRSKRKKQ